MSSSPAYLDPIIIPLIKGGTVLDVGCGYGRWCHLIQSNFWEARLQIPPVVEGFDAFESNVEYCKKQNCYRRVWQQTMPSPLEGKWDTVLACEVIEHIPQEKVEEAVSILEAAAKHRIVFTTPNWPYYRSGGDTIVGFNDYEAHLSYLPRAFFRQRGYKLIGGGFGNPRNFPTRVIRKLLPRCAVMLDSAPRVFPSLGQSLIAYKDFD
jgi:SAM-dependent methyltransferase